MGRARGLTTGVRDAFALLLGTRRGLDGELAACRAADEARMSRPRPFPGPDGATVYYRNNDAVAAVLHREDGPAVVRSNGAKEWRCDGKLHREDGPAMVCANSDRHWYRGGELHRENGPAVEHANGDREWYREGLRHREDGPAVERADGTNEWYREGLRHREDGPAIEHPNGYKRWWRGGQLQPHPLS